MTRSRGTQTFKSHKGLEAVRCSLKASEGYLFPLEKGFFFVPRPAQVRARRRGEAGCAAVLRA